MVQFKAVIADSTDGHCYNYELEGANANSLLGKRVGDEIDGVFCNLPGFKLTITGGSDGSGTPLRPGLDGQRRRRLLLTDSVGFHPTKPGQRKRKLIRGGTISADVVQVNLKITSHGPGTVAEALGQKQGE